MAIVETGMATGRGVLGLSHISRYFQVILNAVLS